MALQSRSFTLRSPDETTLLAEQFAPLLRPGDVLLLEGDIGAGKTHFARSLIQAFLGPAEDVPSPTFTLVQTYEVDEVEVWHADLYRLTSTFEIEELGLLEAFETGICLVEWPDRLGPLAPPDALALTLKTVKDENVRSGTAHWTDARWNEPVDKVLA